LGHETALEQLDSIPIEPFAHNTLLNLFHRYAIIGGMSEVVKADLKTKSLADLPKVYESIWVLIDTMWKNTPLILQKDGL